jgi:hypothetical protein
MGHWALGIGHWALGIGKKIGFTSRFARVAVLASLPKSKIQNPKSKMV